MVLERIVAIQIEQFFEENNLLGSFQFGFRRNKSTISKLLTVFDTLLEAKEMNKEILVLLYDLSAAFDTVSHETLLSKLKLYGFDTVAMKWMKSYLEERKQTVTVCGKMSNTQEMKIGTPQGSRLSPLLFICLMADLDLWTEESILSNFADDTQSLIISDNIDDALETTSKEANNVISFFESNNLVNNADKAAVLYNSRGKGKNITVENIGGETLHSSYSEKLLGLHINSDFCWNTHVEKISIELKKRIGLLKRIKHRIPTNKLVIIAESIFNSRIRYGIAVYLTPIFDVEELKMKRVSKNTSILQTLQNNMIRIILGLKKNQHINMQHVREKIKMMSVNQMAVYHTIIEAYNLIKNSTSEQIKRKWEEKCDTKYSLRSLTKNDLKIPEKPKIKCTGFTYYGSKLFNKLPCSIRETMNISSFKSQTKKWIWENIPSY